MRNQADFRNRATYGLVAALATFSFVLLAPSFGSLRSGAVDNARSSPKGSSTYLPRPEHVVVVLEENHAFEQVIGSKHAPFLNALAHAGALFTASYAVTHPSEPNYLALFAGSTFGLRSDSCPNTFGAKNLATELTAHKLSFGGYSESMPSVGYQGCGAGFGSYGRKHNPWVNFPSVPASCNMPWTSFPSDYSRLPTLAIVVPNMYHDMHNLPIQFGDDWLKTHLDSYVQWSKEHNSLLIVTWDEDDDHHHNRIPTIFVGPMVRSGKYTQRIDHYSVLRTLEDLYGLGHLGHSAQSAPIVGVWMSRPFG